MVQSVKLSKVMVEGLFDKFNYILDFSQRNHIESGIVIITAPNGYGKSTLLSLIDDFLAGHYKKLSQTIFTKFMIEKSDKQTIQIERIITSNEINTLHFTYLSGTKSDGEDKKSWEVNFDSSNGSDADEDTNLTTSNSSMLQFARKNGLRRVGINSWRDAKNGRILSRSGLEKLWSNRMDFVGIDLEQEPNWLAQFRTSLNVLYIPADRLHTFSSSPKGEKLEKVEEISERVRELAQEIDSKSNQWRSTHERSFPSRVIKALISKTNTKDQEINDLLDKISFLEKKYQHIGLLNTEKTTERPNLPEDTSALLVLKIHYTDIRDRLDSIKKGVEPLEIFIETLNKMLLFKHLKLSVNSGLEVVHENGKIVPLRALSSGEQHLIILFAEIIFKSTDSIILLDEPEISLHPEWQELFPKVLEEVIKLNDCMIVMATHSPTLIQDKWDAVIELADQVSI
jgi:predicted ATP-binding protein involved in virulence